MQRNAVPGKSVSPIDEARKGKYLTAPSLLHTVLNIRPGCGTEIITVWTIGSEPWY